MKKFNIKEKLNKLEALMETLSSTTVEVKNLEKEIISEFEKLQTRIQELEEEFYSDDYKTPDPEDLPYCNEY